MTSDQIEAVSAELSRRAAGVVPQPAHHVDGFDPPDGESKDFCEPCAEAVAGDLEVRREFNSDSDTLRWCETCGTLLGYRIGPKQAEQEIVHFATRLPTTPGHWAELLHAMAEVPPEDFREQGDPPEEPSPLWARVSALLAGPA